MAKTPYIYFGTKGYYYESDATGDQVVGGDTATSLTKAGAGILPVDHANTASDDSTSLDAYRIVIKAAASTTGDRANNNTTDFLTGAAFAAAANPAEGDVTVLRRQDYARHDSAGNGVAGTNLSAAYCLPMDTFMGANPVAYAGEHYDGTALDQTDLHFMGSVGTGDSRIFRIIHTAGKYPELVKTMEAIANCGVYNRAITFYDLDINGVETFAGGPSLSGHNDLGIKGCWRTT